MSVRTMPAQCIKSYNEKGVYKKYTPFSFVMLAGRISSARRFLLRFGCFYYIIRDALLLLFMTFSVVSEGFALRYPGNIKYCEVFFFHCV